MAQPRRTHEDYLVGIICALAVEKAPMVAMLDEIHPKLEKENGDDNDYTLGRIDVHNVVIACLPAGLMGNGPAAIVANNMRRSFPIKFGLMVGVGGGVWSKKDDIRLGDVVVSQPTGAHGGVVQWDHGKIEQGGEFRRTGSLNMPPPVLLHALQALKTFQETDGIDIQDALSIMIKNKPRMAQKYKYQGVEHDQLFKATYDHKSDDECEGCDTQSIVLRTSREDSTPEIHYGNIASGNQVMKHGPTRDRIAKDENVVCFEMEAAGLMNDFPCLVIRGICDYADSHKNKRWQPYAAATAAAFARVLLGFIDKQEVIKTPQPPKPLRVLPFGRNKDFVGRQSQLDRLIAILYTEDTKEDCQRAALVGLGGVGKTQIALEVAFQIQKLSPDYSLFWVRASDMTSFETAYRQIGQQLKIPGLDDDKADVKELVRARLSLERSGKWIMIVDNADDFELLYNRADESTESRALHEYLPSSPLGAILFTTRDREAATRYAGSNVIVIEEMDDAESRVLLKTSLQNKRLVEDEEGTTKLLKLLVNLPLAIMQAAAYLNAKGATIAEYLRIYEESSDSVIKLLSKDFEDRRRYPGMKNPVATTWLISFEQIRLRDPLAADYMAFISCINDQDIPRDLLPPAPQLQKAEAIGTLKAFGFIKERLRGESYDMHRLVHITMQSWLNLTDELKSWNEKRLQAPKGTEKYRALALKSVADAFTVEEEGEHWELYQQLLPHAETILAHKFVGSTDQKYKAKLLHNAAWYVSEQGDFRSAEKWMIEAVEIRTDEMGEGDSETLKSMQQLSVAYSDMGKAKEAAELQKRVVTTISEKNNGEEDSDLLDAMALLAIMYSDLGMWSEAEELGQRVVQVSEKLDADEIDIANQKRRLALIYKDSGKLKLAGKLAEEVFEQLGKALGPEDPETLSCMHTLTSIYEAQGKLDKATNLGMQVMETYRRTLGDSHPNTLTIMGDMALIYDRQGKLEEAQRLGELIVVAFEETLGEDHPETLTSRSNLLSVYRRLGKLEEAERRGELVIEVSKRVLGEKHRNTLLKMGDLASTYRDRGKLDKAAKLGLLVLSTRKSTLEESHPDILLGITNLASTYREQGRLTEAEELEKSAEDLRQKQGEDHPRVLASKNNLASIYRKQGRLQEAEELGSQVLKKRMEVLGDSHPETLVTRTDLALTYHKQGRYLKMQETLLGSGHLDTPNSIKDSAGTHESVGQEEEPEGIPEAGDKGVEGEVARARETLVAKKKVSSERRPLLETRGLVWYLALPGFAIAFLIFVMLVASRVRRM